MNLLEKKELGTVYVYIADAQSAGGQEPSTFVISSQSTADGRNTYLLKIKEEENEDKEHERCTTNNEQSGNTVDNCSSTMVVNTDAVLVFQSEQSPKSSRSSSTVKDEQSFTNQSADEQCIHKKAKYIPPHQRNLHEQQQHARRGFSSHMHASYAYQPELGEYSHAGLHVLTQRAMIFPDFIQACDKQSPAMSIWDRNSQTMQEFVMLEYKWILAILMWFVILMFSVHSQVQSLMLQPVWMDFRIICYYTISKW